MKSIGWTKLYRGQFTHWISKRPWCDGYAWCYFYSQANHKPGMVNFRNEYIELERGQFVTSKKKLMKFFGWTRRHVENFLKALNIDHMITYRMTHRYTLITIENYNIYQDKILNSSTQNDTQSDQQVTHRRPTGLNKQECIKNDLRMKKNLSAEQIERNKENITKSKNAFKDIVNKERR